jgi:hypothetical protein
MITGSVIVVESGKLLEIGDSLREGLLADRVLRMSRRERALTLEDRRILESLKKFVELSEEGSGQVSTGRLTANAIDSISAYRTIVNSMHDLDQGKMGAFVKMLVQVKTEIEDALKTGRISPDRSEKTRMLSHAIRKSSIYVVGKTLGSEVEVSGWSTTITH